MSQSHSTLRSPHMALPFIHFDPIWRSITWSLVALADARVVVIVEFLWIARRWKDRGGGKYSNHHPTTITITAAPSIPGLRHILRIPGKLSLPGAPFIAGLAEGRERAWEENGGQRRRCWGAGNLIANTFHSPANFKPISSVYCQSQRARNSSLSVRNEILPVVPFRRSPCPFDLHW